MGTRGGGGVGAGLGGEKKRGWAAGGAGGGCRVGGAVASASTVVAGNRTELRRPPHAPVNVKGTAAERASAHPRLAPRGAEADAAPPRSSPRQMQRTESVWLEAKSDIATCENKADVSSTARFFTTVCGGSFWFFSRVGTK